MARLEVQIQRIDQLHAQSLATLESAAPHSELDSLVASTTSLINSIKVTLGGLGNDARKGGPDAQRKADRVNGQLRKLQNLVSKFQEVEKTYRDKIRERAIRQYRIGTFTICKVNLS